MFKFICLILIVIEMTGIIQGEELPRMAAKALKARTLR
jgi:hypothetical protein